MADWLRGSSDTPTKTVYSLHENYSFI